MGESWQCGKNLFLLLLLSVLLRTPVAASKLQYVALVPSTIYVESTENFCIQMSNLKETFNLTLLLKSEIQDFILIQKTVKQDNEFQCTPFQIPEDSNISPPLEATLELKGNDLTQNFRIHKMVKIEKPKHLVFIQMDKPIYRAGQQVQFRIVSIDTDLHPTKNKFPAVYIQDPQDNQVFQWRDVEVPLGIIQLSYSLSSDPLLGTYKVVVEKDSMEVAEYSFDVDDYVRPKFDLLVKAPKFVTIMTKEIEVSVCGRYPNGKPVPGLLKLSLCRHLEISDTDENLCKEFEDKADGDGCFSKVVNMEEFHLRWLGFSMAIAVEGKITEQGTGVELSATETIEITSTLSKITFENPDRYYKPGLPYVVKVKLVDSYNMPISNGTVEIFILTTHQWLNQVTDAEGRAEFSIETTNLEEDDFFFSAFYQNKPWCNSEHWVQPSHIKASHTAYVLYSPSKSYLHTEPASKTLTCQRHEFFRVHYILNRGDLKEDEIVFYYMVKVRGNIIRTGTHRQPVEQGKEAKGDFLLKVWIDAEITPSIDLLLYTILPSGELVADSKKFIVQNCFPNKAKLWFPDQEGLPGQKTQLHLSAFPGSLCAVHAVDQNVYLLKPEAELSPEKVYSFLPKKEYIFSVDCFMDAFNLHPCPEEQPTRSERIGTSVHFLPEDWDAYKIFRAFGLSIFTNTKIRIPGYCSDRVMEFESELFPVSGELFLAQGLVPIPTSDELVQVFRPGSPIPVTPPTPQVEAAPKRTPQRFLPETWIWDLVFVNGSQGNSQSQVHQSSRKHDVSEEPKEIALPVTIPDTITEWKAGAFCLSTFIGFDLAQPTFLKASQQSSNSE
ncbi:alpha-1-macroglobulin-like [Pantherophis guttatus]|uniref:Alpha-1-macroglobulin-like n=1 Tax=Pantherophis guttatus TaxID=94885 RepID=A0ABM3ZM66_PANGU|nr:alpha-1-macroglobulin-like [Pantherophis guttatus]